MAKKRRKTVVISILYNTKTKKFLGKKGKWVSCAEFTKDPPENQKEVVTPDDSQHVDDPDPGLIVKCIDGVLHYCFNGVCSPIPPGNITC